MHDTTGGLGTARPLPETKSSKSAAAVTPATLRAPLHKRQTPSVSTSVAAITSAARRLEDEREEAEALAAMDASLMAGDEVGGSDHIMNRDVSMSPATSSRHPPARRSSRSQQRQAADDARDDADAVHYKELYKDL
jgi:hypothetical protein